VDEIVVVDTGSTDRTIEIARTYDVVLLQRPWRDDFGWARNEGLAAARGDWILYIDADERLSVPPHRRLTDGLDAPRTIAARVLFHPRLNTTPFREYRLFRNDPEIRFRGAMHETMMPDLRRLQGDGGIIIDSDVTIEHLGYEGDQSHKHARNLPLLRAAVAAEPGRLYYWHHLAETLADMGRSDEALDAVEQVMPQIEAGIYTGSERGVATLVIGTYVRLLNQKGRDTLPAIELGLSLHPSHAQLLLLKAQALIGRGELEPALSILEPLAAIDVDTFVDPLLSYDRRIFSEYAPDMMGVALLRMGRRAEAADAFERAAKAAPDNLAYRAKATAVRPH
jgi:tetratricopeptide (TPR) repeat protein